MTAASMVANDETAFDDDEDDDEAEQEPFCVEEPLGAQGEELWQSARAELLAQPPPSEVLVILDWDDTLLPTSAIFAEGGSFQLHPDSPDSRRRDDGELRACVGAAVEILQAAKKRGRVVIVTNAVTNWVQVTAAEWAPEVAAELEGVVVVSARSVFEPLGFANPWEWKLHCFRRIFGSVSSTGTSGPKSLLCVGDSWCERAAALAVALDGDLQCSVKCVKLLEQPLVSELTTQLRQLASQMDQIMSYDGSLDLGFSPSGIFEALVLTRSQAGTGVLVDLTYQSAAGGWAVECFRSQQTLQKRIAVMQPKALLGVRHMAQLARHSGRKGARRGITQMFVLSLLVSLLAARWFPSLSALCLVTVVLSLFGGNLECPPVDEEGSGDFEEP